MIAKFTFFLIAFFILLTPLNNLSFAGIEPPFDDHKPLIYGSLMGQLGNQMFEVAAISANAWDNDATPSFPDLVNKQHSGIPTNYEHVFFRCNTELKYPISLVWNQPDIFHFSYSPIPYSPNTLLIGLFQNEEYFVHQRDKILQLFNPRSDHLAYINEKYKNILDHPNTVGIQVRNFGVLEDQGAWSWAAQYGFDYFQKAMSLFSEDALFIISSNDLEFARENIPTENKNVIFLEDEQYYIELFLLSMLKHNITSNSSFGWWAAWLNKNPNKIVIAPKNWIHPRANRGQMEVWPKNWIQIDAKWDSPHQDSSHYR